jgi:hypothetical protein
MLVLAMTAMFSGTAFASDQHTKVVSDCQHATYKPTEIVLYCDQTLALTKIKYSFWGSNVAKGTDRTFTNNCKPSCASGKDSYERDNFTLDRPKTERGVRVFTRARIFQNGRLITTVSPLVSPNQ